VPGLITRITAAVSQVRPSAANDSMLAKTSESTLPPYPPKDRGSTSGSEYTHSPSLPKDPGSTSGSESTHPPSLPKDTGPTNGSESTHPPSPPESPGSTNGSQSSNHEDRDWFTKVKNWFLKNWFIKSLAMASSVGVGSFLSHDMLITPGSRGSRGIFHQGIMASRPVQGISETFL